MINVNIGARLFVDVDVSKFSGCGKHFLTIFLSSRAYNYEIGPVQRSNVHFEP